MAVAWALGVWATNSWVGMNGGPPNAWRGESTPAPVAETPRGGGGSEPLRRRLTRKGKRLPYWWEYAKQEELRKQAEAVLTELVEDVREEREAPREAAKELVEIEQALLSYAIVDFPALEAAKKAFRQWGIDILAAQEEQEALELMEIERILWQ